MLLYKHIVDTHMSGVDHNTLGQMAVEALNIQHYCPGLQAAAAADETQPGAAVNLHKASWRIFKI